MSLRLNEIQREGAHIEREFSPGDFAGGADDFVVSGLVSLSLDVHIRDERVQVTGRVTAPLTVPCGRCVEPVALQVDAPFDLAYVPGETTEVKPDREVEAEEFSLAYYTDGVIDLGALMREQFYLALPMKPLCREDCRGLCPMCGTNLNQGTCACRASWEDPRLAVLKSLLPKSENAQETER